MKTLRILFPLVILLCILSCTQEDLTEQIIGTWEVLELQIDDNSSVQEASDAYLVTFNEDDTYAFKTDNNTCGSSYTCDDDGNFAHEPVGCSKVGGDSEFSQEIVDVFRSNLRSFNVNGSMLILEGLSIIKMKKVKP